MIDVDTSSFFAIVLVAAIAAITVAVVPKRYAPPVVVLELFLGIVIGPQVLDLAHSDNFIEFFSNLGLGMLFYFAGYEIDFERIKGRPMKLGAWGWLLSVALAYGIGGILAAAGIVVSFLYTGSAMATTAIGTLIPILRDNGELKTKFGTYLMAAGGAGEFGPILLVTLVLSTASPLHESVILLAFIALALILAMGSVRYAWRGWPALEKTFEASSQLAVRITVVLVFGLVLLANQLGLDVLLGGFVAGMITRAALRGHELHVFESKLTAVGFGFFVPFFFITSGLEFDLNALGSAEALAKLAMFLGLFLVVRGRRPCCSTEVPSALATERRSPSTRRPSCPWSSRSRRSRSTPARCAPSTAAGLVGAAMLSTLIYPFVGMALRKGSASPDGERRRRGYRGVSPRARYAVAVVSPIVSAGGSGRRMIRPLPGA